MPTDRDRIKKLTSQNKILNKVITDLVKHIQRIERRCKKENLWLIAGYDPYKALEAEQQQGPLITKLFELTKEAKKIIDAL